jgi:hypothetical protein
MWMHQYCPFGQFFGTPFLTKEPKLLLNDDKAGKPEGIHLMIGRRRLLVLHDDGQREYQTLILVREGQRRRFISSGPSVTNDVANLRPPRNFAQVKEGSCFHILITARLRDLGAQHSNVDAPYALVG